MLSTGLYTREQSSTLYTVITVGKVVKVSSYTVDRAVMVKLGLAVGRAASC